jgi:hypothetical protein
MSETNQANNNISHMPRAATVPAWLIFPVHERLSGPDAPQLLKKIADSYQKLEVMAQTGLAADKTRARLALKAYTRALELLDSIHDLQEQMRGVSK